MSTTRFEDLQRKVTEHTLKATSDRLKECCSEVVDSINLIINIIKSSEQLDPLVKKILVTLYKEIKSHYDKKDIQYLINESDSLLHYTETYLENHNKSLITGMLYSEGIKDPHIVDMVENLLGRPAAGLQAQYAPIIKALQDVKPYAIRTTQHLDPDFHADSKDDDEEDYPHSHTL